MGVLGWTPSDFEKATYVDMQIAVQVHFHHKHKETRSRMEWERLVVKILSSAGNYKKPFHIDLPWDRKMATMEVATERPPEWDRLVEMGKRKREMVELTPERIHSNKDWAKS
jgi:TPP-dependent 2-oxoacid decarboxylase